MEAILREMVRRGWQPPSSDLALASIQPGEGLPILAVNPELPVWVATSRGADPIETGETVDTQVEASSPADINLLPPPPASAPTVGAPAQAEPQLKLPTPELPEPALPAPSPPARANQSAPAAEAVAPTPSGATSSSEAP